MGKNKNIIVRDLLIQAIGAEGKSIGRYNDRVVFVPLVVPGDVVDVRIKNQRKSFWEGTVIRMVKESPMRQKPICDHFGICGGCKWQMLPYAEQIKNKEQQVTDQLTRIGHLKLPPVRPIIGAEQSEFYRNKLEFTFSHFRWLTPEEMDDTQEKKPEAGLGFHVRGLYDRVIDVEKCWLQPDPSNEIRNEVRRFSLENGLTFFKLREQTGLLRTMHIRVTTSGEVMVVIIFAEEDEKNRSLLLDHLISAFPNMTSLQYGVNTKGNDIITDLALILVHGKDYIVERIDNLQFNIGAKSFFQTNTKQAHRLYGRVKELAGLTGQEIVYDLYTGTGTIALFLAGSASKVIGVESVPEAIEDAYANAALNGITNCNFVVGDTREILTAEFVSTHGHPDVLIVDPPRAGLHADVVETIRKIGPESIIYVSCNPATQARDLALLGGEYDLVEVQPIDMFPHTHHVENIVKLQKNSKTKIP